MSFIGIPNYKQPIINKGVTDRSWYLFFSDLFIGKPAAGVSSITSMASPLVYQASAKGFMMVSGGTVTIAQFTRDGVVNFNTGQTSGIFPLAEGDTLMVSYSVAPTFIWVPL